MEDEVKWRSRATKVSALSDEAKEAARDAGLDDNRNVSLIVPRSSANVCLLRIKLICEAQEAPPFLIISKNEVDTFGRGQIKPNHPTIYCIDPREAPSQDFSAPQNGKTEMRKYPTWDGKTIFVGPQPQRFRQKPLQSQKSHEPERQAHLRRQIEFFTINFVAIN
ncbi:hypothetical protein [Methylocystis sp.]|uniref:hypothetical protein n=1 Tax=Methylocystis sp. TaxID=1911079 RepID=UPI0025D3F839|nr:hypothetical protein [Methylocystis sp.]